MSLDEIKDDVVKMVCKRQKGEIQAGVREAHRRRTEIQKVMDSTGRLFALAGKFTCAALHMDLNKNRVLLAVNENTLNVSVAKNLWLNLFSITEVEKNIYLADYLQKLVANVLDNNPGKSVYGYNSFADCEKLLQIETDFLYSEWVLELQSRELRNSLIVLKETLVKFQETIWERHTVDVAEYELALEAAKDCSEILKGLNFGIDNELISFLHQFQRIDFDLTCLMQHRRFKEFEIVTPFSRYNFHAEMKIISGLYKSEHFKTCSNEINIGISKYTCLMCEMAIKSFNDSFRIIGDPREIIVRGHHGKAYKNWNFPIFPRNKRINGLTVDEFYKRVISKLCLTYQKGYVLGFEYLKDAVSIESLVSETGVQSTQTMPAENYLTLNQARLIVQDLENLQLKHKSSGIIFFNRNVKTLVGTKKYSPEEIMSASD